MQICYAAIVITEGLEG